MTKKIISGQVDALGLYSHQTQVTFTPVSHLGIYKAINFHQNLTDLVDKDDAGLNFDSQ